MNLPERRSERVLPQCWLCKVRREMRRKFFGERTAPGRILGMRLALKQPAVFAKAKEAKRHRRRLIKKIQVTCVGARVMVMP